MAEGLVCEYPESRSPIAWMHNELREFAVDDGWDTVQEPPDPDAADWCVAGDGYALSVTNSYDLPPRKIYEGGGHGVTDLAHRVALDEYSFAFRHHPLEESRGRRYSLTVYKPGDEHPAAFIYNGEIVACDHVKYKNIFNTPNLKDPNIIPVLYDILTTFGICPPEPNGFILNDRIRVSIHNLPCEV